MSKGVCSACKETFNSVTAFDSHRYGSFGEPIYKKSKNGKEHDIVGYTSPSRHCLTPIQMWMNGLLKNEKGWWVTSLYDDTAHEELA